MKKLLYFISLMGLLLILTINIQVTRQNAIITSISADETHYEQGYSGGYFVEGEAYYLLTGVGIQCECVVGLPLGNDRVCIPTIILT